MSKSSLSAGQPGTSHGSVEGTGQDELPPSAEALARVVEQIAGYALTLRSLLVAAEEVECREQAHAVLSAAEAVVGQLGLLADETARALGNPGMFSDPLGWLAPHMRQHLSELASAKAVAS